MNSEKKWEAEQEISPVLLSAAGYSGIQKFIIGHTKWHADFAREQNVPTKQCPDVAYIFNQGFFLTLIFFQFNYSASLINTVDMTAVCVISVLDIWSVLARSFRGALAGIVFPTFMMASASDQLLLSFLFNNRGEFEKILFCLFFTFLEQKLTCSKVQCSDVVCFKFPEKRLVVT